MKLKRGINIIIFSCQQKDMSIEWMSEDSIFIVKVEQYILRSKRKRLRKTFILFIIHVHKFWGRRRKEKNSFNLARSDECFSPWCTILTSPYGVILGFYHLITGRMPPPVGGREFHWCSRLKCQRKMAISQLKSHNDGLKFILKIISNIKLIGFFI